jgi:hypothetical protein
VEYIGQKWRLANITIIPPSYLNRNPPNGRRDESPLRHDARYLFRSRAWSSNFLTIMESCWTK